MTRIKIATFQDFSIDAFDEYYKAKKWREKVTSRSYMEYWISWFGDNTYTIRDMEHKFHSHRIIVAYQPSKLPDWTTSIMGLMFYKKCYNGISFIPKNLYIVTFMEKRKDFNNNGFMDSAELCPALNRRFLKFFNTFIDTRNDSLYLMECDQDSFYYIKDKIEKVEESDAKYILQQSGIQPQFYDYLYCQKKQ